GHSVVGVVLGLGKQAEARALALHHHEPERADDALDGIAEDAAQWAAENAPSMRTIVAREGLSLELRR
ncbi:MAG TPA: hypothetical protein VIY73_21850, partial [Polyangiaceae bacterium]